MAVKTKPARRTSRAAAPSSSAPAKPVKRKSGGTAKGAPVPPPGIHSGQPAARRAPRIYEKLLATYPDARCALEHRNAFELLVATILSAQCTDVRVNLVTPQLFSKYPDARAFASAPIADLEAAIRSTGFFRNKAKSLQGASRLIVEKFAGKVPDTFAELLELPGVARKTANVVLGNAFDKNEGVVVDTHVARLSGRLGLSKHTQPEKIERDLMGLFPQSHWTMVAHLLIFHGRTICFARKPACERCPLSDDCPKRGVTATAGRTASPA